MNIHDTLIAFRENVAVNLDIIHDGVIVKYNLEKHNGVSQEDIIRLTTSLIDEYHESLSTNGVKIIYDNNSVYIDVNHYFDHYFQFNARLYLTDGDAKIIISNTSLPEHLISYYHLEASKSAIQYMLAYESDDVIITLLEEYRKTNILPYDLDFLRERSFN